MRNKKQNWNKVSISVRQPLRYPYLHTHTHTHIFSWPMLASCANEIVPAGSKKMPFPFARCRLPSFSRLVLAQRLHHHPIISHHTWHTRHPPTSHPTPARISTRTHNTWDACLAVRSFAHPAHLITVSAERSGSLQSRPCSTCRSPNSSAMVCWLSVPAADRSTSWAAGVRNCSSGSCGSGGDAVAADVLCRSASDGWRWPAWRGARKWEWADGAWWQSVGSSGAPCSDMRLPCVSEQRKKCKAGYVVWMSMADSEITCPKVANQLWTLAALRF